MPPRVGPGVQGRRLASILDESRLRRVLARMLDENEFLSDYGLRSLSRYHADHPYSIHAGGQEYSVSYLPAESDSGMFGGNSNWRGPVWFPLNALIVEALHTYAAGSAAGVRVEFPTGSGERLGLHEVAQRLEDRLVGLFRPGPDGRRPGDPRDLLPGPLWTGNPTFAEYFHGDTGVGLGATHQTGWTALVAHLICTPQPAYDPGESPSDR